MEILKNNILKIFFLVMLSSVANASLDDFLSGTPAQKFDYASPSSISSQVRGYYNFGGATVRNYSAMGQIRPFHIETPSIHSGCSGVDIVFGGFSYLNLQYLVEKLKKIATAAPAFVFQLALSTLCKDCEQIAQSLDAIADAINQLNFDGCKAAVNFGKAIGGSMSQTSFFGDNTIDKLKGESSGFLANTGQAIGEYTSKINATINCTDGGYFGVCDSKSDPNKTQKVIEKDKFQGSMLHKFFSSKDSSGDFLKSFKDDEIIKNWLGKSLKSNDDFEGFFRSLFGDIYGYVDPDTCDQGKDDEGGQQKAFLINYIQPVNNASSIVSKFFFNEDYNSTLVKNIFPLTFLHEKDATKCGAGFKEKAVTEIKDINLNDSVSVNGQDLSLSGYLYKKIKDIAISVENGDQTAVKNSLPFLNSLKYPAYHAINIYSVTNDEELLKASVKYIMAYKSQELVDYLIRSANVMQNLINETDANKQLNNSGYFTYIKEMSKTKEIMSSSAQKQVEEAQKALQKRVFQIKAYEDVKNKLIKNFYGGDSANMGY